MQSIYDSYQLAFVSLFFVLHEHLLFVSLQYIKENFCSSFDILYFSNVRHSYWKCDFHKKNLHHVQLLIGQSIGLLVRRLVGRSVFYIFRKIQRSYTSFILLTKYFFYLASKIVQCLCAFLIHIYLIFHPPIFASHFLILLLPYVAHLK